MSRPDIRMPFYVGDFLAETTRLDTEQKGAYLLLLLDLWKNGSLPDDDATLARITRLPIDRWKEHRPILANLFYLDGSDWHHERIKRGRATAEEQRVPQRPGVQV